MQSRLSPKELKKYFSREIKEFKVFDSIGCVDFSNLYRAVTWLYCKGYDKGSLSLDMPIAIVYGKYELYQKWYNLTEKEKNNVDGVMLSDDFRNGVVKILIFKKQKKVSFETN